MWSTLHPQESKCTSRGGLSSHSLPHSSTSLATRSPNAHKSDRTSCTTGFLNTLLKSFYRNLHYSAFLLTCSGRCLLRYPLSKASSRKGFFRTGLSWKKAPILAPENHSGPSGSQTGSSSALEPGSGTWADLTLTRGRGTPRHDLEQPPDRERVNMAVHTSMDHSFRQRQRWKQKSQVVHFFPRNTVKFYEKTKLFALSCPT